ncbi:hypothetical protein BDV59DRAFT_183390 [Aspergillus ambiguus]|uniref:uncharacterized protein n=1 Tax=Aspergillus ambiguus TaxID=176160 RepID=UPI003CCD6C72
MVSRCGLISPSFCSWLYPTCNREHLGRHCMNIIDCVVFLLRPLPSDTLFCSQAVMEIRLNDMCRAGGAGFSCPRKVLFMISSAWCCGNCIDRVLQHRAFYSFGSRRVVSLPLLSVFVSACLLFVRKRFLLPAVSLCFISCSGPDMATSPSAWARTKGTVRVHDSSILSLQAFFGGYVFLFPSLTLHLGLVVHQRDVSDRDGILCIVYGVGLSWCVHKKILYSRICFLLHSRICGGWEAASSGAFYFLNFFVVMLHHLSQVCSKPELDRICRRRPSEGDFESLEKRAINQEKFDSMSSGGRERSEYP